MVPYFKNLSKLRLDKEHGEELRFFFTALKARKSKTKKTLLRPSKPIKKDANLVLKITPLESFYQLIRNERKWSSFEHTSYL